MNKRNIRLHWIRFCFGVERRCVVQCDRERYSTNELLSIVLLLIRVNINMKSDTHSITRCVRVSFSADNLFSIARTQMDRGHDQQRRFVLVNESNNNTVDPH
jgi:hypothetical protein